VGADVRKTLQKLTLCTEVTTVGKKTLNTVPCPVCAGAVEGITVDEESIAEAKRVPVLIPAKCKQGHQVVLFVDKQFTVRDVEAAGQVVDEGSDVTSIDKAQKWMDSF
jgi:RecJ-like exonuclease